MSGHTLVVGGTRGGGKAFALLAAERGERVSVIGRRKMGVEDFKRTGVNAYSADITDAGAINRVLARIAQRDGLWTSLVFFQKFRGEGDAWLGEWQISLDATKRLVETCVKCLPAEDPPSPRAIVVVGSVAGSTIIADQPIGYHAAKAALENMVRYWAVRLGPLGVRVNMVSPHAVLKEESADFYLGYAKLMDLYKKIIPLGRMGTAREVARAVSFLCSEEAAYVTGQNLFVDGGITLQMAEGPIRSILGMER